MKILKGEGFTTAKGEFQIHLNVGMDRLLVIPLSGTYKLEVYQITGANGIRQYRTNQMCEFRKIVSQFILISNRLGIFIKLPNLTNELSLIRGNFTYIVYIHALLSSYKRN